MKLLILNLFLAMVWAFLQGELQAGNFVFGFLLGYIVIFLMRHVTGAYDYTNKVVQSFRFVVFVAWDLLTASLQLAWLILSPELKLRPAIVAVPLDVRGDVELVLFTNLITLSPGTLSMDVSDDRRTLYVHTVTMEDADEFRRRLKTGLERRVMEITR